MIIVDPINLQYNASYTVITMKKYDLLENQDKTPLTISYGDLGLCPLVRSKLDHHLGVLKIATPQEYHQQISILSKLTHPNILKIKDAMQLDRQCYMIIQFAPNGDLYSKIKHKSLSKSKIKSIFQGVANALFHIHSHGFLHRNLKPQNIMLGENFIPKIMDFGMAARSTFRKTICGCYYYMAPQILLGGEYSQNVDVWALGAILYEMIEGKLPYQGTTNKQILTQIKKPLKFSTKFNNEQINIIKLMLKFNNHQRININNVLKHPYLVQPKMSQSTKLTVDSRVNPNLFNPFKVQPKTVSRLKKSNQLSNKAKQQNQQQQFITICGFFKQKITICMQKDQNFGKYYFSKNM